MEKYEKRGYLNSEFKIFHLTDNVAEEIEYHYHDFDKITIFIKGNVNYTIEGKTYKLQPYDIVLVNHNDIHRLTIDNSVPYERIIVYISPDFMKAYETENYDLNYCFRKAAEEKTNVMRVQSHGRSALLKITERLERAFAEDGYAKELYCQLLFLEFMIQLNRAAIKNRIEFIDTGEYNTKVVELLEYINQNLTADLNIDKLSKQFFVSKYYMMRLFKEETGYTIGNYVASKRLLYAKELIAKGVPITRVCFECGFNDYSTFSRAYKKEFHETPRSSK